MTDGATNAAIRLTRREAAKYAGVSYRTLANWIAAGHLPEISVGRFRRVLQGDLDDVLQPRRRKREVGLSPQS